MSKWDKRYDTDEYVYGTEPNEFLRQYVTAHDIEGKRILAIAEGEGRNAVWLASHGNDVEMWDGSRVGLEKAERLAATKDVSIKTKQVDLSDAVWEDEAFDVVVCIFGHFPPDVRQAVFDGVKRTLKPGGLYVTEVYHPDQLAYGTGGPSDATLLYTVEAFKPLTEELDTILLRQRTVERQEGRFHHGQSSVVQYVGMKR